jgi:hypothetical protein
MLPVLVAVALLLSAADHWTTYLCLTHEAPGVEVTEGNPLAAWLFATLGLGGGLVLDSLVTVGALAFLVVSGSVPRWVKLAFLGALIGATGLAVANNLGALAALRQPPFGLPA